MKFILFSFLKLWAASTVAEEDNWFNAQRSLERAGVGTHSPALAPPVRVEVEKGLGGFNRFERLECYYVDVGRNNDQLICKRKEE